MPKIDRGQEAAINAILEGRPVMYRMRVRGASCLHGLSEGAVIVQNDMDDESLLAVAPDGAVLFTVDVSGTEGGDDA